ncbi:MAG: RNA polymerase-binding protein DksA [Gammaproteobacteria bacterium]|nr:RNA polymerase-binding protein DksA [Gammaproteobacteria bacterium]
MAKQKAKATKKKSAQPAVARKKAVAHKKLPTSKKASTSKTKVVAKKTVKKIVKKAAAKPVRAVTKKKASKVPAKPAAKKIVKAQTRTAPSAKALARTVVIPKPIVEPVSKVVPTKTRAAGKPIATPAPAPAAPPEKKLKPEAVKKPAPKTPTKPASSAVRKVINLDGITLASGYKPSQIEEYMSPQHLTYFRQKLRNWRQELILESQETLEHLRTETRDVGDEAERASRESDNILELRTRDRYRKLLNKIDQALKRIEEGNYGFCEETGEEIGLGRLEARPIATLTVDAQERRELLQRQFRDDH